MKSAFMILVLLVSQVVGAETVKEKKNRKALLKRVDTIVKKLTSASEALEKEKVSKVCKTIDKLFDIYPDHLVGIGTHMNLDDRKILSLETETKEHLVYIHQQKNTCEKSEKRGEHLDPKKVLSKFEKMIKELEAQKEKIEKADTSYQNNYNYYYEF